MAFQVFEYHDLHLYDATITDANTNVFFSAITAPATGLGIDHWTITSDDTVDRVVQLAVFAGSPDEVWASVLVPAGSGTNGVDPAVDLFAGFPTTVDRLNIPPGQSLLLRSTTTVTPGKVLTIIALGGSY